MIPLSIFFLYHVLLPHSPLIPTGVSFLSGRHQQTPLRVSVSLSSLAWAMPCPGFLAVPVFSRVRLFFPVRHRFFYLNVLPTPRGFFPHFWSGSLQPASPPSPELTARRTPNTLRFSIFFHPHSRVYSLERQFPIRHPVPKLLVARFYFAISHQSELTSLSSNRQWLPPCIVPSPCIFSGVISRQ